MERWIFCKYEYIFKWELVEKLFDIQLLKDRKIQVVKIKSRRLFGLYLSNGERRQYNQ